MFFQVTAKSLLVFLSFCVLGSVAFANEKAEKKEAKVEEKKEGETPAEGEEGAANETQKKQQNEANELQTRVQALQAKVKTKEEAITKLIEEKNQTKDPERIKEIIQQMVVEHKEMGKMIEEYEQNRSLLRYRYPEKGYKGVRTYERMEVKPLEQMESKMSVEAKLKRNMKTVHSQFGLSIEKNRKKKKGDGKNENLAPSLTEPIVIQK